MPAQTLPKGVPTPKRGKKGDKYAPTAWGSKNSRAATIDLTVPSGQRCRVRTVGVPGLIEAGILANVDSLTSIVATEFVKKDENDNPIIDIPGITDSEGAIKSIMEVMDKVTCLAVVEPHVYEVPMVHTDPDDEDSPLIEGERIEGRVYVDTVDDEDKVFIFQAVVGGTQDLEQFRERVTELVGGLDVVEPVEDEAE
jgi:hypothetical protein